MMVNELAIMNIKPQSYLFFRFHLLVNAYLLKLWGGGRGLPGLGEALAKKKTKKKPRHPAKSEKKCYLCKPLNEKPPSRSGGRSILTRKRKASRGVAQLVSAPRSGRGGRKFESSHPDNQQQKQSPVVQTATGDCFFHIPLRRNAGLIPDCRFMIMLLWL